MQVKVTRGTDSKGIISKTRLFTLTIIAQPTPQETEVINKWGGGSMHVGKVITDFGDAGKPLYNTTFAALLTGYQWKDEVLKRLLIMEENVLKDCANVINWCQTADSFGQGSEKLHEVNASGAT